MNKNQLISRVSKATKTERDKTKILVEAVLGEISIALQKSDRISIIGFGSFEVAERPARTGFNIKLKSKMEIKPTKSVKFTPSPKLKEEILQAKAGNALK